MLALLSTFLLFVSPPPPYEQASAELDMAIDAIGSEGVESSASEQAISRALERVAQYPANIPDDDRTRERLIEARLSLVWLHLAAADTQAASAAMDEAIRSGWGRALPAGRFGPAVLRLYEQRSEALAAQGTATIEVDCGPHPCVVIINESWATNPSAPLYLGSYRVWVGGEAQGSEWEFVAVELHSSGEIGRVSYRPPREGPSVDRVTDNSRRSVPDRGRMLPRWAGIAGLSVGAGLIIAGAILHGLHGKCVNGEAPVDWTTCPRLYQTSAVASRTLLASGVGVSLLLGTVFTVDEVRVGRSKGRQAMLSWTFRF
jgi:hypothetical protein